MAQTKAELVEELESQATKADLIDLLQSKLLKDDLAKLLDDESGATKEELVHKLESLKKDELVEAVASHINKDELQKVVEENREDDEDEAQGERAQDADDEDDTQQEQEQEQEQEQAQDDAQEEQAQNDDAQEEQAQNDAQGEQGNAPVRDESTEIDWSAELEWAPPPRPTPAPVRFVGAAPFQPGQRVRVDLAGLPMLGVFAGKGASAAGTIVGVDARERQVRIYLDSVFDGAKEIVVPPERVLPDG